MALEFKLTGTVLEIKETLHSFFDTKVSYWYYDIQAWTRSLHGKKGDAPVQPCTDSCIAWVRKHYLPHVGIYDRPMTTAGENHG